MAIIMLAIGLLLSAIGLYALVTGYPMIEIERGWASVIAGSVLLSGGLVVVALGLVLRAVTRLRGALRAEIGESQGFAHALPEPSFSPIAPSSIETAPYRTEPLGAAIPALAVATPVAAAALAAGYGEHHEPPATAAPPEPEAPPALAQDAHEPHEMPLGASEPPLPAEPWEEREFSAFDYAAEPEAHATPAEAPHALHPEPPGPPLSEDHPKFADETLLHDPEPDTLDALPHESPGYEPPAHEPPAHEMHEPDAVEPEHPEHAHPTPEALVQEPAVPEPAAEAPATAPESPPANLTVIGRYDSEGTSYVMYSDGSIEAQSEAGIYRFSSMAELKAFIEG